MYSCDWLLNSSLCSVHTMGNPKTALPNVMSHLICSCWKCGNPGSPVPLNSILVKQILLILDRIILNILRESLFGFDSLTDNTAGQLNSVAEALLLFLESLAEPVIPYAFYSKCLDSCSNFTLCKQVSLTFNSGGSRISRRGAWTS